MAPFPSSSENNRRKFLKGLSLALGSTVLGAPFLPFQSCQTGTTTTASAEAQEGEPVKQKNGKLGVALVGLGGYSTNQLAPALQETENCYLAGIVTGTPSKIPVWQEKYNIPDKNVYNYENFDSIADNPDIDIVYVVLPNSMHAEYTIRAAKAKKHVICEKPMATNVQDAQRMIDACRENGVQLSIGYRLHYEPFNQRVMEIGQKELYGKVIIINAEDSFDITTRSPDVWRLDKELAGGGPLMDIGIYCMQGAIYTLGKPPIAVSARFGEVTHPTYFDEVEQSISWRMDFENGAYANCHASYAEKANILWGKAERGWWQVKQAFGYNGKQGETLDGPMNLPETFEQVTQMDSQALAFKNNQSNLTPGEMGLRDVKILMAIYESARNGGKRVEIKV